MKKITEKFENGLLVERITEETTAPGPFATGVKEFETGTNGPASFQMSHPGSGFTSTSVRDYLGDQVAK